ncbi:MAG: hypothetical protein L0Z54_06945, partial [Thermoplasmata archaeon]|nr:hypothetical protein [Thermoplasmata archaeon]
RCGAVMQPGFRNCPSCGWRPGMVTTGMDPFPAVGGRGLPTDDVARPLAWLSAAALITGICFLYWGADYGLFLYDISSSHVIDPGDIASMFMNFVAGLTLVAAGLVALSWCFRRMKRASSV